MADISVDLETKAATARWPRASSAVPTVPTVSVRQAAYFLAIGEQSVRRGLRDGTIPGFVYGRRPSYRVDRQALLGWAGLDDYDFEAIR